MPSSRRDGEPRIILAVMVVLPLVAAACSGPHADTTDPAILAGDLEAHVGWLASDALQGRLAGSPEAHLAARYLAAEFRRYGLEPAGDGSGYLQSFPFVAGVRLGNGNSLETAGPAKTVVGTDWRPLAFSDDGLVSTGVVFAGYGISVPDEGYDDYAGIDVTGKVVLVLPYGPALAQGGMRFPSHHSLRRKASTARDHRAAAILFAPHPTLDPPDYLEPLRYDSSSSSSGIMAATVTASTAAAILGEGTSLSDLQERIDTTSAPASQDLPGTHSLNIAVVPIEETGNNVLGILRATDPQAPWIVIGAHYDHLGMGGDGSLAPDEVAVHNGADDNASGTAGVLELAQHYAAQADRSRNLLFAAFTGEEEGLLGSAWLAGHLPEEVGHPEAMINMDMIGRLTDGKLTVYGTGTSPAWDPLLDAVDANPEFELTLTRIADGFGASDHSSFYAKKIPVLHLFTGTHGDYHRPSDDPETLHYDGMAEVVRFVAAIVDSLSVRAGAIAYSEVAQPETPEGGRRSSSVYSGVVPDFSFSGEGLRITGVTEGSPAATAGLEGGDVIVRFGQRPIRNIYDYQYALDESSPGQRVELGVERDGKRFTVQVVLGNRRSMGRQ